MSLRKIKMIRIVCLCVGLLGAAICYLSRNFASGIFVTAALVIAVAALVIEMICWFLWRCPHCGRLLHRNTLFAQFCPRCGESLFEE